MTDRLFAAYALMVVLALGFSAAIWWTVHNSHGRTYKRRVARDRKQHQQKKAVAVVEALGKPDPSVRDRA